MLIMGLRRSCIGLDLAKSYFELECDIASDIWGLRDSAQLHWTIDLKYTLKQQPNCIKRDTALDWFYWRNENYYKGNKEVSQTLFYYSPFLRKSI